MKLFLTSLFALFILSNSNAQCTLSANITVDASGNIVTTNTSTNADPSSYVWYVYNLDLSPSPPLYLEYIENAVDISYAPMSVANYMICLVANESGNNNSCDSLCDTLTYTQSMMTSQQSADISDLANEKISVYPIPATNVLFVEVESMNDGDFSIFNALGVDYQCEQKIKENRLEISVADLPKGIYFLNWRDNGKTIRFVVQ